MLHVDAKEALDRKLVVDLPLKELEKTSLTWTIVYKTINASLKILFYPLTFILEAVVRITYEYA